MQEFPGSESSSAPEDEQEDREEQNKAAQVDSLRETGGGFPGEAQGKEAAFLDRSREL